MNRKRVFEIELEFYEECKEYIERGSEPRDEIMEACYRAYAAIQEYGRIMKEKEGEK